MRMPFLVGLIVSAALVGGMSYLMTARQHPHANRILGSAGPVADFPATLDLGDHEFGEVALGHLTIANGGQSELVLQNIRSNCSCAGLEREDHGRFLRLESLHVNPGEHADLVIRVSVRGVPAGAEMRTPIYFETNDPRRPTGQIVGVVRHVLRGVSFGPSPLVFGSVPVGADIRQVIDIRDTAVPPRTIERIVSSLPDRVRVRLLPEVAATHAGRRHPDGALVAKMEVKVATDVPGEVSAAVEVHLAKEHRQPDCIRVMGRVVPPVEVQPSTILLPRVSAEGPLYDASCLCRSTNGKPLQVEAASVPAGLKATVLKGTGERLQVIRVHCDPSELPHLARQRRQVVRLRAKAGGKESILELPVLISR